MSVTTQPKTKAAKKAARVAHKTARPVPSTEQKKASRAARARAVRIDKPRPMTDEIKATIVRLVETELRTVAEVCHIVGINPPAYYGAIHSDPDFAAALVAARRRYADTIVVAAKRSLLLRIEGFEYTETQELRVPAKDPAKGEEIKERRYTTKRVLPDVNAIMFALTNYAPDEFSKTLTEAGGVAAVPTLTQKQADEFAAKFLQGLKNNE